MNRQPKTIKQLRERLKAEYLEIFPYGKHKGKQVKNVVREDPNYIVWWDNAITAYPIEPDLVKIAEENYRELNNGNHWRGSIGPYEHWGEDASWEDMDMYPESVLGDPWDPKSPF